MARLIYWSQYKSHCRPQHTWHRRRRGRKLWGNFKEEVSHSYFKLVIVEHQVGWFRFLATSSIGLEETWSISRPAPSPVSRMAWANGRVPLRQVAQGSVGVVECWGRKEGVKSVGGCEGPQANNPHLSLPPPPSLRRRGRVEEGLT